MLIAYIHKIDYYSELKPKNRNVNKMVALTYFYLLEVSLMLLPNLVYIYFITKLCSLFNILNESVVLLSPDHFSHIINCQFKFGMFFLINHGLIKQIF